MHLLARIKLVHLWLAYLFSANDQARVIDLKPVSHPYQWFSNVWSTGLIFALYYKLERKIILPYIFNNLQNLCGMIVKQCFSNTSVSQA